MSLSVELLCHSLPLYVVAQDLLSGHLGCLGLLGLHHPHPGQGLSLELWGSSIKDKDRLDLVEQQFTDPMIETQQVSIGYHISLLVPEPPESLSFYDISF